MLAASASAGFSVASRLISAIASATSAGSAAGRPISLRRNSAATALPLPAFLRRLADEQGHEIRRCARGGPLFLNADGDGASRTSRRAELLHDPHQRRFHVVWLGVKRGEAIEDAALESESSQVWFLVAGPLSREQLARGEQQHGQVARPEWRERSHSVENTLLRGLSAGVTLPGSAPRPPPRCRPPSGPNP